MSSHPERTSDVPSAAFEAGDRTSIGVGIAMMLAVSALIWGLVALIWL